MEHSDNFLNWLKDSGAFISPKIAIKDFSDEGARLGIVALENIKKDEILFTVPRKCILSRSSSKFSDQIKKNCKKIGWIPLMWSIILEKLSNENESENKSESIEEEDNYISFWDPYFKILPDQIYLPAIWSPEDLKLLDGTGIEEMIPNSSNQFRKYFLNIKSKFPQTAEISDQEFEKLFHYAGCLISAYSFCEDPDREINIGLVPLADTLNHRTGFNNARLYYEKDFLKMICHEDCLMGEQLFNTYGDLGNRELLIKYGFVDEPNPFHTVSFDPVEWLRDHVVHSKIVITDDDSLNSSKRICDSDKLSFNLFDKFDGQLSCQLIATANGFDFYGIKSFIDWIYLLSSPAASKLSSLKPRTSYKQFLSIPENINEIVKILQARRALLKESSGAIQNFENYCPKIYTEIIKNQDRKILDGFILFLKTNYL